MRQLEAGLPDVQVKMPLEEGPRNVRLANGYVITATHKTIAPQWSRDTLLEAWLSSTPSSLPSCVEAIQS